MKEEVLLYVCEQLPSILKHNLPTWVLIFLIDLVQVHLYVALAYGAHNSNEMAIKRRLSSTNASSSPISKFLIKPRMGLRQV